MSEQIPQWIIDKVDKEEREKKIRFLIISIPILTAIFLQQVFIGNFIVTVVSMFAYIFIMPILMIFTERIK